MERLAVGPEMAALCDLEERGDEAIKDVYRTLARSVAQVEGDIVECGVYRGRNLSAICDILPWRDVWAFDSFEGFPEPGPYDTGGIQAGQCSDTSVELVQEVLDQTRCKRSFMRKGWFEDTLRQTDDIPTKIAFLSVDCDLYESVRLVLDRLASHVVPGGIIVLDDWGAFEGCRRAFYNWARNPSFDEGSKAPLVRTIGPTQAYFHV